MSDQQGIVPRTTNALSIITCEKVILACQKEIL